MKRINYPTSGETISVTSEDFSATVRRNGPHLSLEIEQERSSIAAVASESTTHGVRIAIEAIRDAEIEQMRSALSDLDYVLTGQRPDPATPPTSDQLSSTWNEQRSWTRRGSYIEVTPSTSRTRSDLIAPDDADSSDMIHQELQSLINTHRFSISTVYDQMYHDVASSPLGLLNLETESLTATLGDGLYSRSKTAASCLA
jgi:hypothetical protein